MSGRGYAYNAGLKFTNISRSGAKRTRDGKQLIYSKLCRRFVRSVNRRLNSSVDNAFAVLWADRAWRAS